MPANELTYWTSTATLPLVKDAADFTFGMHTATAHRENKPQTLVVLL